MKQKTLLKIRNLLLVKNEREETTVTKSAARASYNKIQPLPKVLRMQAIRNHVIDS
jgi:hypothetical protein